MSKRWVAVQHPSGVALVCARCGAAKSKAVQMGKDTRCACRIKSTKKGGKA